MNDLTGQYFVKNSASGNYTDFATLFDGLRILKIDGMTGKGQAKNVYTASWEYDEEEDFAIVMQDDEDPVKIIRECTDLDITFIIKSSYATNPIDVHVQHAKFIRYMTNTDVWVKSMYQNELEVHCVCLKEYKPTTEKYQRGTDSWVMGTLSLHMLEKPADPRFTPIVFEDPVVKQICVENWGNQTITGEITEYEAARITTLGDVFRSNTTITSFDELRYFTGLTVLNSAFEGCTNLTSVILPACPLTTLGATFSGCEKLVSCEIPTNVSWEFNNSGLNYAFMNCEKLEGKNGTIDLSMITASGSYVGMTQCFTSCKKLTKIITPNCAVTLDRAFSTCSELVTLQTNLSTVYGTGSNRLRNPIGGASSSTACKKLANITYGFRGANLNLQLGYAPLTHESVLQVINGLGIVSSATLTLSAAARATLTEEEIAIATEKGWRLETNG